ncbi:MAG: ABC transporter ATP-binding protein [Candidatus Hydrogenedentes bacterium]|nr:ABC transporter ATP-binding protein [Candidatus Hydrogenedentota bacterium]
MSAGFHMEDEAHQKAYDAKLMRRLMGYVKPYTAWFSVAVVLLFVASIIGNFTPLIVMKAIDTHVNNPVRMEKELSIRNAPTTDRAALAELEELKRQDRRGLFNLMMLICLMMLAESVFRYVQMIVVAWIGQKTMFEMRMKIFSHLQNMSLRFLDKNPLGRLMTRVTNDVEKVQATIVAGVEQTISDMFTIVVVVIFMLWTNWQIAAIVLSTIPFVFITGVIFRKFARKSYLEVRRKVARLNAYMQEMVSGMRVVQVFRQEARCFGQFREINAEHRDEWFRQIRNFAIYYPIVDFLGTLALTLIIFYHGWDVLGRQASGENMVQVGLFFAYLQWAERLYGPIRALTDRYNVLLEAMASSERIFTLLDTPEDIPNKPNGVKPKALQGRVEFRDVWFGYDAEHPVLKGINLTIEPGERIAIVGHTGAGKTTFINLLGRFYDIQRGSILVDGVDVRDYDKTELRRRIGIVLQDVFLFSGSIKSNISLNSPGITDETIRECAAHVNAAPFIESLPEQYEFAVGERGGNLSTGQRQLLAFARALAHDPQILILDEATSSVDTATEALIQDAILKLMDERTSIVIAHRLSTVQHADRIVVMHHGEIREVGTHQELLAHRGLYYTLYRLQYKDQSEAA